MDNTKFKLALIAKKAAEQPKLKFNALMHLLNVEYLQECFSELKNGKAPGVDRRTRESYTEEEAAQALRQMVAAMKNHSYRPQPVRRVFIPKANGKTRPLGIPTVTDKVLQLACAKILEMLFEPIFLKCSYGFRPNLNAREALKEANHMIMGRKVNWIIDADIASFFDNVNHDWMMKAVEQRIADPNLLCLIRRFLKAGAMAEGKLQATPQGAPQGGIISPILANIYLHYVLDLWFEIEEKPKLKGFAQLVRYADDFVIGAQYEQEAKQIIQDIKQRFAKFGLTLAQDKTRILEFGRFAQENRRKRGKGKPQTFDFLGFTHYCGKTGNGRFAVKVKTSGKKFSSSLKAMNLWLKAVRSKLELPEIWRMLALKLQGHYNYYGMSGNFNGINNFYCQTRKLAFKWTNRRSQKASWNWESFGKYLDKYPLPKPKLTYVIYNTW